MLLSKICDSMETVREIRMSSGGTVRIAAQKDSENSSQKKPKDSVQRTLEDSVGRNSVGFIRRNDERVDDIEITGISLDSRKVEKGFLFVCLKGLETDGHKYIENAVNAGAVAVVYSEPLEKLFRGSGQREICYIKVEDTHRELAVAADAFYGSPSLDMTMFAVTGTNGKTTTASIISDVFSRHRVCGYMGTIALKYGKTIKKTSLTTPDPVEIQAALAEMREHGMQAAAMEVSSHGLAMRRTESIDFDCAVFTNLTYDHLDYHKTMDNYFDAKKTLFRGLKKNAVAVLNRDDEKTFSALAACSAAPYVSYGIDNEADYMALDLKLGKDGSEFTLRHMGRNYKVVTNLIAKYNIYNLLAAIAAMNRCGMSIEDMLPHLGCISQVDGRMDMVKAGQDYEVVIDYAHTPDGFEKIFEYAREVVSSDANIYAVFGSAGKRDRNKRKVMGEIAGKTADLVIVTEEDPRDESPERIADDIVEGINKIHGRAIKILDRKAAIEYAVDIAKPGDMVLILGKGTEDYMDYEDGKKFWEGDMEVAAGCVKKRLSPEPGGLSDEDAGPGRDPAGCKKMSMLSAETADTGNRVKKPMLFSPGPVMTSEKVRNALLHYDICHRSREFEKLYKRLCTKVLKIFDADDSYKSVLISGSGTAANEAVLSSVFRPGDKALLIRNGEFGDRLKQMLDQYKIPYADCRFEWGTQVDTEKVEQVLNEDPDITLIAMVYHETSSGMLNPAKKTGELADRYSKKYFLDCVSAAGGQKIEVAKNNVTFATTVGGKCIGAYPGSAIICFKEKAVQELDARMGKNVYLNLYRHYEKAQSSDQTPNTPNVNLFWALEAAIDEILSEGLDHRIERYRRCASVLREGMKNLGLKFLLPEDEMANTVTSVFLPEGKELDSFIEEMEKDGYTVYPGKNNFHEMNVFQVANMGEIYREDCMAFLRTLEKHI